MAGSHSLQDLIIEKAGELFREQGYSATTINQIGWLLLQFSSPPNKDKELV